MQDHYGRDQGLNRNLPRQKGERPGVSTSTLVLVFECGLVPVEPCDARRCHWRPPVSYLPYLRSVTAALWFGVLLKGLAEHKRFRSKPRMNPITEGPVLLPIQRFPPDSPEPVTDPR